MRDYCLTRDPVGVEQKALQVTKDRDRENSLWQEEEKNIYLEKTHKFYYQVQTQMAILEVDECDFVVWTTEGFLVIPVKFNPTAWEENSVIMKRRHHELFIPEYFLQRTPRNLKYVEIPIEEQC